MKKIILIVVILYCSPLCWRGVGGEVFAQAPNAKGNWQWLSGMGSSGQVGGASDEIIMQMKMDKMGNTYVCGIMYDNPFVKANGQHANRTPINNHLQLFNRPNGFVAKYNCDGQLQWYKTIGDTAIGCDVCQMLIDTTGNLILFINSAQVPSANFYIDNTLIIPKVGSSYTSDNGVLLKLDPNGNLIWYWTPTSQFGNQTHLKFNAMGDASTIFDRTENVTILSNDTISIFMRIDTSFTGLDGLYLVDFSATTGQYLNAHQIINPTLNSGWVGAYFGSLGKDIDGNFLYSATLFNGVFTFLDSTINTPMVAGKGAIFKFNRTHLIDYMLLYDSVGIDECNFDNIENGFELSVGAGRNLRVYGNFICTTNTNSVDPLLHFSSFKNLKWGVTPDTAVGGGFGAICSDSRNNIYSALGSGNYVSIQGNTYSSGTNMGNNIQIFQFHGQDSLIQKAFPDRPQPNNNYVLYTHIATNEKGDLIASGFNDITFTAGQDTAFFSGGVNDMFVIKYGYPCSSDSALIEPVATDGLIATCSMDSIHLTWNDISNIEWGYHIYRAVNNRNGVYQLIATTPKNINSFYDNTIKTDSSYYYKVAAFNNISDGVISNVDSILSCKPKGINVFSYHKNSLKIYPNPTQTGQFTIGVNDVNNSNAQLQISNYIGQILIDKQIQLHQNFNQYKIDLSNYSSGTYLVTVKTSTGMYNQKVMVVR
ncbi:MAG: hypothetical protein RJA07_382 [Bacteroidota bacterium]|jgi:hypothetical protein